MLDKLLHLITTLPTKIKQQQQHPNTRSYPPIPLNTNLTLTLTIQNRQQITPIKTLQSLTSLIILSSQTTITFTYRKITKMEIRSHWTRNQKQPTLLRNTQKQQKQSGKPSIEKTIQTGMIYQSTRHSVFTLYPIQHIQSLSTNNLLPNYISFYKQNICPMLKIIHKHRHQFDIFHPKSLLTLINIPISNRKSQQQLSYFKSRQTIYEKHHYPHYKPTITISQYLHKYQNLKTQHDHLTKQQSTSSISTNHSYQNQSTTTSLQNQQIIQQVAGRITAIRKHGKTTFIDIREQHLRLQVTIKTDKQLQLRRGDIIGIQGSPFITKKGQLSLNCPHTDNLILLAPCLWMLPQYQTLKQPQSRFRNKPLDLITNSSSLSTLKKRAKIISTLRNHLEQSGYMEVQTPTLSLSSGGAIAKPFITYHNDHKVHLYLRIAPQLYLKKLLIGGIHKIYEIGKNFRNQSIDQTHNPQFTTCQLYAAYSNYQQMITFTYQLINKIAIEINGTSIIKGRNAKDELVDIDLSKKWQQIDFMSGLQTALELKLPIDFHSEQTIKFYDDLCIKNNIPCQPPRSIERLLDKLAGRYLETTHEPLLITNHPLVLSPLAKPIPTAPHLTQRFQLFINGIQLVNSYTQLNNPKLQKQTTPTDLDFVQALQYGLMPCAGWGMGIDRLVMLLTQKQKIQEVISFPLLRDMLERNQNQGK